LHGVNPNGFAVDAFTIIWCVSRFNRDPDRDLAVAPDYDQFRPETVGSGNYGSIISND